MIKVIVKNGSGVEIRNQIFATQAIADEWITSGSLAGSFGSSYTIEQSDPSLEMAVTNAIVVASKFGQQLILDFGIRNVLAGKSETEIDNIMEHAKMSKIAVALQSGSLKYAKRQLETINTFSGLTQEDIDWMLAKINNHLGV